MYERSPFRTSTTVSRFGAGGPPPRDIIALLAVVFVTYSMQFFELTAALPQMLRLTPRVLGGWLWQLVTYPYIGYGGVSLWILLELLILFWFGRDVFYRLGRRRFWTVVLWATVGAAVAASLVVLIGSLVGSIGYPFQLMQGQRMLLTIFIAAFATLNGEATILLFFVLPIRARWFLPLEILFAFIGFLGTRDAAGFVGICTAVAVTFTTLSPGGPRRVFRDVQLWVERATVERRLKRMRRGRRFHVIDGDGKRTDRDTIN